MKEGRGRRGGKKRCIGGLGSVGSGDEGAPWKVIGQLIDLRAGRRRNENDTRLIVGGVYLFSR